uniref:ATP synthase complex subunit 8 n=1 Tax=Xenomystus nigri TaxID=112162 RepID=C4IX96_XENNI|nr:ATP synthase F0 subunit 8 [Xenomystus nigri]BAH58978.1 ATPase subunits 8 [Xenomystus nigri]BAJ54263.1 ATPase subunits 8 [Xenomystus nigri]
MPQLNPAPWLLILLFSWFVLLVMIPPKIMSHHLTDEPTHQTTKKHDSTNWTWPWH